VLSVKRRMVRVRKDHRRVCKLKVYNRRGLLLTTQVFCRARLSVHGITIIVIAAEPQILMPKMHQNRVKRNK
jgi:hypothetical protein